MTVFLGRLGTLCWWTAATVNLAVDVAFVAWAINGGATLSEWLQWWFVIHLVVEAPIFLIGMGLCYLFRGTVLPWREVPA